MLKLKERKGFSLAEVLIVVGIIGVVAAVSVIAVTAYLRSMTKLEYDGYAKEIFIAAQNHLSAADEQSYLGRTYKGTEEVRIEGTSDTGDGVYYFVKSEDHDDVDDVGSVLNIMLPFAAVDETVRGGGRYVIRYHKDSSQILDVFYWEESGRYKHTYSDEDYAEFIKKRDDRNALKKYDGDDSVIGYYGGTEAKNLTYGDKLEAPLIEVVNADKLTVTVTDLNSADDNARLKLIITGLTSGHSREITLSLSSVSDYYPNPDYIGSSYVYTIVLDDITASGKHFYNLFCEGENPLIAGEDIEIYAVSFNNSQLTNVAYSAKQTTNSLFAYNESGDGAAHVSSIRHLENLDAQVSHLDHLNTSLSYVDDSHDLKARQTTDLSWSSSVWEHVYSSSGAVLANYKFKPVNPEYTLRYDGGNHSVSGVEVAETSAAAGMFGSVSGGRIENLKLIDFAVSGADAGALAGSVGNGAVISNVVSINSGNGAAAPGISGSGSAGGLIGRVQNSTVEKCAAALTVSSSGNAGGLIGTAGAGTSVSACYSGGRTKDGKYLADNFNVTGTGKAGGLIGEFSGGTVVHSYSTCSASGEIAGGLFGTAAATGKISDCYATGLVGGETKGAFAGTVSGVVENCSYYEIINETAIDGDAKKGFTYLPALGQGTSDGIGAFDADAETYDNFVGADTDRKQASAYDAILNRYYKGSYRLLTVEQLGAALDPTDLAAVHYGDWPAPEVWVVNEE